MEPLGRTARFSNEIPTGDSYIKRVGKRVVG